MKAGGLQKIKTMGTLWGWRYQSRARESAHIQNKMADGADEIFVWGDNFETILDILEGDEEIEEQFTSTVSEVHLVCAYLGSWRLVNKQKCHDQLCLKSSTNFAAKNSKEVVDGMSYLSFDFFSINL